MGKERQAIDRHWRRTAVLGGEAAMSGSDMNRSAAERRGEDSKRMAAAQKGKDRRSRA